MPPLTLHMVNSAERWQQYIAIRRNVFIEEQSRPEEVEFDLYDNDCEHFLAIVNGRPLGTARVRLDDTLQCYTIERMAISPAYRRNGYGRAFFNLLVTHIKNKQVTRLILHTELKTVEFYRSTGCVLTGVSYPDNPVPCVEMELKLN